MLHEVSIVLSCVHVLVCLWSKLWSETDGAVLWWAIEVVRFRWHWLNLILTFRAMWVKRPNSTPSTPSVSSYNPAPLCVRDIDSPCCKCCTGESLSLRWGGDRLILDAYSKWTERCNRWKNVELCLCLHWRWEDCVLPKPVTLSPRLSSYSPSVLGYVFVSWRVPTVVFLYRC